jgi:hypothetical protein
MLSARPYHGIDNVLARFLGAVGDSGEDRLLAGGIVHNASRVAPTLVAIGDHADTPNGADLFCSGTKSRITHVRILFQTTKQLRALNGSAKILTTAQHRERYSSPMA